MKKTEYKVAWFKIDFKRTADDKLVIVDIGGGQTSAIDGFDADKVRGAFCHTVLKYFDRLFISSCFQDATFKRHILKDFILAARSNNVLFKSSDDLQAMLAKKMVTANDMLLFVDQLKTPEIYCAYQHRKHSVPVISGDGIFHILYRDKSAFYRLQTCVGAQSSYWHYPINISKLDLEAVRINLPPSKDGYYLKPSNLDVAQGIEIFKTKQELINHLQHLQKNERRIAKVASTGNKAAMMIQNEASDYYDIQPKVVGKEFYHKGEDWDPTGRAFITLVYDADNHVLIPEINGCNWILPNESLKESTNVTATSLANVANSKKFVQANEADCEWLKNAFLEGYSELFKLCFSQTAETILNKLCETDGSFQTYCQELIYDNPRFYVGKNAEVNIKKALSDHAERNVSIFLSYAKKHAKEHKFQESLEYGNAAVGLCDAILNRKLASQWYITIYSTLGAIYCSKQDYVKALEMYEKVREYSPKDQNVINSIKGLRKMIDNPSLAGNARPAW